MREEKKMSDFNSSTFAAMKAAGAEVPVFIPGETNKRVPVADFAGSSELLQIAVYGETTYAEVAAMLDGGAQDNQPRSKCIPVVCVLKYDMEIPYPVTGSYGTLTRGTTMPFTGIDSDGIHFGHTIAHSTSGTMPPVTIFAEALLNSQNVWSIKLRNSFQVAGIDSGSGAAVMSITPGMGNTATFWLNSPNAANSKGYVMLPTSLTMSPPKMAIMRFLGFNAETMNPGLKEMAQVSGASAGGVSYPSQSPTIVFSTTGTSGDAGIGVASITVYSAESDYNGCTLKIGTEFLSVADPYDRTHEYSLNDYCITATGLWRLSTTYTPPAEFDSSKWTKTTLIELIKDVASHALQSVATDSTLTGDGTSAHPLSVAVDSALDNTSENPVQNKVLYGIIGDIESLLGDL